MSTPTSTDVRPAEDPWGERAEDWAEQERRQIPTYEAALERVPLDHGARVLDVGSGAGTFLTLVANRGARVAGLDASPRLTELARRELPEADLRAGEMEALPWPADSFDLVTGFNSFFFAADAVAALREVARVARPGASVVAQVWGRPERCDMRTIIGALAPLLGDRGSRRAPAQLWEEGVLEDMFERAGIRPLEAFDVSYAVSYDDESLTRSVLAAGPVAAAARRHGERPVTEAVLAAADGFRVADGSICIENEWHLLVGRAS